MTRRWLGRALVLVFGLVLGMAGSAAIAQAQPASELRNWFDDPFFQVSSAIPDCPLPAGPYITEAERQRQTHHRAERGTTCWLAHECDQPNAYAYDPGIARALQAALHERNPFADTTLWVTVQGRVVYIEGCVTRESVVDELEGFARAVPEVQQAIAIVRVGSSARPPYRLRDGR